MPLLMPAQLPPCQQPLSTSFPCVAYHQPMSLPYHKVKKDFVSKGKVGCFSLTGSMRSLCWFWRHCGWELPGEAGWVLQVIHFPSTTYTWAHRCTTHLDEIVPGIAGAEGPLEEQGHAFWGPLCLQQLVILLGVQVDLPILVTPGILQRQTLARGTRHPGRGPERKVTATVQLCGTHPGLRSKGWTGLRQLLPFSVST